MEKHHEKQLHPNEIDSDSTAYEPINNSTDEQSTALSSDESTEFVNSMQISQAVKQKNNNIHDLTDSADSSIPAGETLPLPTAEEVNQALIDSDKAVSHSEDTRVFSPSEDSHVTEPINSYDALDSPNEPDASQFNQQTETLPIFNQSSPEINTNDYPIGNGQHTQYEQASYQNSNNVFDNPSGNYSYATDQTSNATNYTYPQSNSVSVAKKTDNSLFLKRFIPIALMVFSAFASMGIIAHAAMNQSYGGPGYGPQRGMYNEDYYGSDYGYDGGAEYGYGYNNGSAQTQSATLSENSTPSDNNSSKNDGKSGNNNTPSDGNSKGDANGGNYSDFSQGGMPGDGSMQGPPEGDMGYMEMGTGLTTPYVLALAFCAIVFACSLVYIIVTRFGKRPFALDKNTKMFSALGVAGIALVMTGGLTAGGNTLMAVSSGISGGNRYGDSGGGYDYGYYDDYGDNFYGSYGYYDDYGDGYYYDNGDEYDNGRSKDNSKDNSKGNSKNRSKDGQQPNSDTGNTDVNIDYNGSLYSDI